MATTAGNAHDQRTRASDGAARTAVRIRRRRAAGAGAGRQHRLCRADPGQQANDSVAGRAVRIARVRRAAARSDRLRPRPDQQGIRRRRSWPRPGACCRCTSAATACSSPYPIRPTCRRSTRSGSRPTSSSTRSSSRTTSSARRSPRSSRRMGQTLKDLVSDDDLEVDIEASDTPAERRREPRRRRRASRQVHPEDPARRDRRRRVRHPLRAVREVLPHPLSTRRHTQGSRAAAAGDQGQDGVAHQGHLQARHLGKTRAAGRAHEARPVEDPLDRLSRQHAAHAVRREDRAAYSRLGRRQARHRGAGLRARPAAACCSTRSSGPTA